MQEQENDSGLLHGSETIGWIATTKGSYNDINGLILLESETGMETITHEFTTLTYGNDGIDIDFNSPPNLLTKLTTYNGGDPALTRIMNITSTSFEIQIDEDTSRDSETNHTTETIGYIAIGQST